VKTLGRQILRRPRIVAVAWLLLTVIACGLVIGIVGGDGIFARATGEEPQIPGSESQRGTEILANEAASGSSVTLAIQNIDPGDEDFTEKLATIREDLSTNPDVDSVVDPTALAEGIDDPLAAPLVADDEKGVILVAYLDPLLSENETDQGLAKLTDQLRSVGTDLRADIPGAQTYVGGEHLIAEDILKQGEHDLMRGGIAAAVASLLCLMFFYRGSLIALVPIMTAWAATSATLAALWAAMHVWEINHVVINIAAVVTCALSLIYGLIITSRFRRAREESEKHVAVRTALKRTRRPIQSSAAVMFIALGALLVFPPTILRTLALASMGGVIFALAAAWTFTPGLLTLFGWRPRSSKKKTRPTAEPQYFLSGLVALSQRFAWPIVVLSLVILAGSALPLKGMEVRNSTLNVLPKDSSQRDFVSLMRDQYPAAQSADITVIADASIEDVEAWADQFASRDDVTEIGAPYALDTYVAFSVRTTAGSARHVAQEMRSAQPDFDMWTTGEASRELDFTQSLQERAPFAVVIAALAALIAVFGVTGSVMLPIKALFASAIPLFGGLSAAIILFPSGQSRTLDPVSIPAALAIGFGVVMWAKVFLFSQIRSWKVRRADNEALQRAFGSVGTVVTAVAILLFIIFGAFGAGGVVAIRQIGVALAVAVLLDATLVRFVVLPATFGALKRLNWWSP